MKVTPAYRSAGRRLRYRFRAKVGAWQRRRMHSGSGASRTRIGRPIFLGFDRKCSWSERRSPAGGHWSRCSPYEEPNRSLPRLALSCPGLPSVTRQELSELREGHVLRDSRANVPLRLYGYEPCPTRMPSTRGLAPQSIPFASIVGCLVALDRAPWRNAASSAGIVGHRASEAHGTPLIAQ